MNDHVRILSLFGDGFCHETVEPPEALRLPIQRLASCRRRSARGTLAIIVTKLPPVKTALSTFSYFTQLLIKERDTLTDRVVRYMEVYLPSVRVPFASTLKSREFSEQAE